MPFSSGDPQLTRCQWALSRAVHVIILILMQSSEGEETDERQFREDKTTERQKRMGENLTFESFDWVKKHSKNKIYAYCLNGVIYAYSQYGRFKSLSFISPKMFRADIWQL